ncbi:MAG TPA: aminotransferase class V-fold PLP-dependent enzyme [Gammaproteobacteria bacterium]
MDIEKLRADTPGCAKRVHLNNAGAALPPSPVIRAVQEHFALEAEIGGYEAADARADAIDEAYRSVAALIGADPRNVAFTESATASYAQALSSIPFERGDVILTTRNDYVSNQLQFLSLEARLGVRVQRAPDAPPGGVDVDAVERIVRDARPHVVCVTHVPTNSGLVQDVERIGRICREHDVLYLVDACQSVGQMPIDVRALGCDFLSATSRKFLRGPRGAGFLYVSDRVLERGLGPLMIDLHGAEWIDENRYRLVDDAKRFETFEFAWALVLGLAAAARYARDVGLDAIQRRVRALADRLRAGLAAIDGVRVLDRGPELCAIVSAALPHDPRAVMLALRERGINANAQARPSAVLDFDAKGVAATLRLSPHYYNTEAEIDTALDALRDVLAR